MLKKRIVMCLMMALLLIVVGIHLACPPKVETIKGIGVKDVKDVVDKIIAAFEKAHRGIKVTTAEEAATATVETIGKGTPDVHFGMMTREPTAEEITTYPDLKAHLFARDGVAVVVHPDNPVTNLTVAQLRDIYAGKIKCWSVVGGEKGAISALVREEGSEQRKAVEATVMGGRAVEAGLKVTASMDEMKTAVAGDKLAIGYILGSAVDETVKAISLNGVAPTLENIKAGTYKITLPFYIYTKGDPAGATKTFVDYLLSPEGQKEVEKLKLASVK